MVKLPDLYRNRVKSPAAPRAQTISPQAASMGARSTANAIEKVGNLAETIYEDKVAEMMVDRDLEFKKQLEEANKTFNEDTNYETHQAQHEIMSKALVEQAVAGIPNADAARRFRARVQGQADAANQRIADSALRGLNDQKVARLEGSIRKANDLVRSLDYPKQNIAPLIAEQVANIEGLVRRRTITAREGQRLKDNVINDLVKGWDERERLADPGAHSRFLRDYLKKRGSKAFDAYDDQLPEPGNGKVSIGRSSKGRAVVKSSSGANFEVSPAYSKRFAGLVNDLEALGLEINPKTSGGYSFRTIDGSTKLSRHAHAEAIDINWDKNARGIRGEIRDVIPEDKIRQLAKKWGLKWGGDWKNPDDMHFEVDRGAKSVAAWDPEQVEKVKGKAWEASVNIPPEMSLGHRLLKNMSDVDIKNMADAADAELRRKTTAAGLTMRKMRKSDLMSIESTGEPVDGVILTPEHTAARERAYMYYESTKDIASLGADDMERRLAEFNKMKTDAAGKPEFADMVALHKKVEKAYDEMKSLRKKDPVLAVEKHTIMQGFNETVYKGAEDREQWEDRIQARLAAQRALGIDEADLRTISKDEAYALLPNFDNVSPRDVKAKIYEAALKAQETYGAEYAQKVMRDALLYRGAISKNDYEKERLAIRALEESLGPDAARYIERDLQAQRMFGEDSFMSMDELEASNFATGQVADVGGLPGIDAFGQGGQVYPMPSVQDFNEAKAKGEAGARAFDRAFGPGAFKNAQAYLSSQNISGIAVPASNITGKAL